MSPIFIVIFLSIVGVLGDFFIKLSGNGQKYIDLKFFALGAFIYALTAFGWFYVMKHLKLDVLGVIYSISTLLVLVFVGAIYFKESFDAYEIAGIVLAVASVLLLRRFA